MRYCKAAIQPTSDRKARFIASTSSVDTMGDTIDQNGWELSDFKKNPVVLYAHDTRSLPVGKVSEISVQNNALVASVDFIRAGVDDFADKVATLVKEGFLSAVSVGFSAIDYEPRVDKQGFISGYNFKRQALKELSIVPVPANAEALAISRSLNLSAEQRGLLFVAEKQSPLSAQRNRLKLARVRAQNNFYNLR